ncbi:MAG: DNA polymerase IV, partial [Bacillota bacterium]
DQYMKKNCDILLCDLDAFFASVEQLDNPDLRDKPVLVGGNPDGRGVVSTCSYEARKYGVRSAMPMKKAVTLCPGAVIIRGRMSRYKDVSLQVRNIFERFTPDIEFVSIDEAYLAVKNGHGLETGIAIHHTVRDELQLPISVGISVNKLLAKIACELAKPNNVDSLWPAEIEEKLWPLSVRALPGIGPVAEKSLNSLGIKTVQDLAAYPAKSLKHILGNNAEAVSNYAHGLDNRELELEHQAKSISEETTFAEDIFDHETMKSVLMELSAGVGYRLRSSGLTAKTITFKLRYRNFRTITRSLTIPEAIYSDRDIYQTALNLFKKHCGGPPWRLVGVQASGFEKGSQMSLFRSRTENEKESRLTETRDKLRKKFGSDVIIQGRRLK